MTAHDLIIVGGGPAGLSAAIFAGRMGLDALLLEKAVAGGQPAVAHWIEDYPGLERVDGWTLVRTMARQAQDLGVAIVEEEEVVAITAGEDGAKRVVSAGGSGRLARAVIVATGGLPKPLGVPGEERLSRKGVHYCAQCAGAAYAGRRVVVCGNGHPALSAAFHLTGLAAEVLFITREQQLKGDAILAGRLAASDRCRFLTEVGIVQVDGMERVERVEIADKGGKTGWLAAAALFVYRGLAPATGMVAAEKDGHGFLRVGDSLETSMAGVFAAGNAIRPRSRVVIAAGEGARAALATADYLVAIRE